MTQNGIKHVLRERWHAWSEARKLYDEGYRPEWERAVEEESMMEDESKEVDPAPAAQSA